MSVDGILQEARQKMAKSVEHLENGLQTIRTGRANPALIEQVRVPYYGTPTPLNQLAQISAPEPRLPRIPVISRLRSRPSPISSSGSSAWAERRAKLPFRTFLLRRGCRTMRSL